jgi:DNA/RNA-binding domain of Phe-tRNA-synthetase-like protein
MLLAIDPAIVTAYPALRIGVVVASGIDNHGDDAKLEALREQARLTAASSPFAADWGAHPLIRAWREVYRGFGINLKKDPPTLEYTLGRLVKGKPLRHFSKVVDAYLAVQVAACLPTGGYDLGRIIGPILLRYSTGGEPFVGIGSTEPESTAAGEIVYSDDTRVLTRRWNYKDCDHAKVTEDTTDVALFVEAPVAEIPTAEVESAIARIAEGLIHHCGGHVRTFVADVREKTDWPLH